MHKLCGTIQNYWKKKQKKVNCDNCNKMVFFSDLKNVGDRYKPLLVCRECYYKLG